ncbi:MAG: ATP-dependent DNA helicase Rep [Accumulibacter sp.]|uniref:UvrD-helicase domain-containing protein n=1 Tax=Accumulibacter sp. TaxID=2053492 RepID=UPI0011F8A71F|nr:UvrD-helicase domain-containing protein [Accumulibacter sp.]TLD46994.1 MAG: ATP-dependent DNA helicase Rep [Accumulibacter sp.]
MTFKPKVALAQDFLASLATLAAAVQGKVLKWALRFQSDPTASGINYEPINGARDRNLKSVRIDQDWRGIVFKPPAGDVYVLMYVDHHDDAYRWAEGRRVAVNPTTGALQVFAVESLVEPALEQARLTAVPRPGVELQAQPSEQAQTPMFAALSDADLLSIGTPEELLGQVRSIRTEFELDAVQDLLPVEAYEGLFLIAAGDSVSDVLISRETRVDRPIDTEDFATAIETAESQSRFVVVADEETMAAMLNSPLAQWRVFLHPTQRKLAQGDRGGPMRVLGGAGTGKTVLAMHRAKWLAENRATAEKKVFFTTFTRNLAADIEENLKTFCSPGVMQKIEVKNLDAWVHGFLRRYKYDHQIIYNRKQGEAAEAWQHALALQDTSLALPPDFYEDELERVVLAQGINSRDDYRQARRTGRGVVLTRGKRDAIWPIFEEYRAQLASRKLKEVDDAYRDAAAVLRDKPPAYSAVIADETQDFGPQALRLLRAMVPAAPNDLLFVGDGHQRIYPRNRASMSASGINIRGRSRKLYLNYRTTEEIRRLAVATLEGCAVDDLDEGSDEVRRYKSLSHGPIPRTLAFQHLEDALSSLLPMVQAGLAEARSVCVIVPTRNDAVAVQGALKAGKLPTTLLGPDERDNPDSRSVRVSTMHRAKGLEFDEVVLLSPRDCRGLKARPDDLQRLQYVAMTRARKVVTLVRY